MVPLEGAEHLSIADGAENSEDNRGQEPEKNRHVIIPDTTVAS